MRYISYYSVADKTYCNQKQLKEYLFWFIVPADYMYIIAGKTQ